MSYHRRNLPHLYPPGATLFLTWRLFGSLPRLAAPVVGTAHPSAGKAFLLSDRQLDRASSGPLWLKDPRVAQLVVEALKMGATDYHWYDLLAWVVMPNHVHLVFQPLRELPEITRWIKGSTARYANLLLGRTGKPFWQYESYDHCIRNDTELDRVIRYVEGNPVVAGLAEAIEDWPWSSAWQGTDRPKGLFHIWQTEARSATPQLPSQPKKMVESRAGASTDAGAPPRFPSPLIKPDVPISSIRLSDWFHRRLTNEASTARHEAGEHRVRRTPLVQRNVWCRATTPGDASAGNAVRGHRRSYRPPGRPLYVFHS
jgi:putative transposase